MTLSTSQPSTIRSGLNLHTALALFAWLALCFLAGTVGALFQPAAWYAGLTKPSWNPPGWIFGPVWSVLYSMMAVAAWLVWRHGGISNQRWPLAIFLLQLLLNAAWSPIFFGLQSPGLAFADIVMLWLAVALTIAAFGSVRFSAAGLLVPYLAWVSFAAVLNFTIWRLNP